MFIKNFIFLSFVIILTAGCSTELKIEKKPNGNYTISDIQYTTTEFQHTNNKFPAKKFILGTQYIPDVGQTIIFDKIHYMVINKNISYDGNPIVIVVVDDLFKAE